MTKESTALNNSVNLVSPLSKMKESREITGYTGNTGHTGNSGFGHENNIKNKHDFSLSSKFLQGNPNTIVKKGLTGKE